MISIKTYFPFHLGRAKLLNLARFEKLLALIFVRPRIFSYFCTWFSSRFLSMQDEALNRFQMIINQ